MKFLKWILTLIAGLSGIVALFAGGKNKEKVKQIKKAKATVQKRKASVQTKKAAVKKAQKKKPVKKPSVTSAKKARASLKSRAKR